MKLLNRFFREDETLSPRMVVITGLLAFVFALLAPYMGLFSRLIFSILALVLLVPLAFSAFRYLVPLMDPRDPSADRIAVWGGCVLVVIIGIGAYGLVAVPALAGGAVLLWQRAPELLENFDMFEQRR